MVPHHGSRTSSTPAFVAAVAAAHAVITSGHRNRFGHPRAEVVARYERHGAQVHRTDRSGALSFEVSQAPVDAPDSARHRHARYWHDPPDAHRGATP
jgi:competence protein ComEC